MAQTPVDPETAQPGRSEMVDLPAVRVPMADGGGAPGGAAFLQAVGVRSVVASTAWFARTQVGVSPPKILALGA